MMALNVQGPWNSCKLWGRSWVISWPLVCTLPLLWLDAQSVVMCDTPSRQSMASKSNYVLSCHGLSTSRYNPPTEKKKKNTVWNFSVKLSFGFLSVSSRISEHCFWSLMEFVVGSRKEAFSPFPSPIREMLKKKKKPLSAALTCTAVDCLAFLYPGSSLPMEGRKNQSSGIALTVAFPVVHVCGDGYKAG